MSVHKHRIFNLFHRRTLPRDQSDRLGTREDSQQLKISRPTTGERIDWRNYWNALGYFWRIEPEINENRKRYLNDRLEVEPNIEKGIYPFKDIALTRADVEWLLATYESDDTSIYWTRKSQQSRLKIMHPTLQREQVGLDLRGAILNRVSLSGLPLRGVHFGLTINERATREQQDIAGAHLEQAALQSVNLEGAWLSGAYLEGASLFGAHLENAFLPAVHLENADLDSTHLENAFMTGAYMESAILVHAYLEGTALRGSYLEGANFSLAPLKNADLSFAHLEGAIFYRASLEGARLDQAHLEGKLMPVDDLERIRKWNQDFPVQLPPANLREVYFDATTSLDRTILGSKDFGCVLLLGVRWNGVDLSVIDWTHVKVLGDERIARQSKTEDGEKKDVSKRREEFQLAVRTNRQLAVVLQAQGLSEEASHFAYKAQMLQRAVFWRERKFGLFLLSLFLDLFAGYGYRLLRSFITYGLVIGLFMIVYHILGTAYGPPLRWREALVVSMTAFHGRGFFPEQFKPGDPQALVAAIEAFVGLVIEVTLIATLTQRLFGK